MLPAAGPLDIAFDAAGSRVAAISLDESLAIGQKFSGPSDFQHPDATLWTQAWDGVNVPNFSDGTLLGTKIFWPSSKWRGVFCLFPIM